VRIHLDRDTVGDDNPQLAYTDLRLQMQLVRDGRNRRQVDPQIPDTEFVGGRNRRRGRRCIDAVADSVAEADVEPREGEHHGGDEGGERRENQRDEQL
jgi:hypothetical protein